MHQAPNTVVEELDKYLNHYCSFFIIVKIQVNKSSQKKDLSTNQPKLKTLCEMLTDDFQKLFELLPNSLSKCLIV